MIGSKRTRLARLEMATLPPKQWPRILTTFAEQCGKNGETIRTETDEEAIARHLAKHPEDTGLEFDFIIIASVHGRWNDQGELVCNAPECRHYNTVS